MTSAAMSNVLCNDTCICMCSSWTRASVSLTPFCQNEALYPLMCFGSSYYVAGTRVPSLMTCPVHIGAIELCGVLFTVSWGRDVAVLHTGEVTLNKEWRGIQVVHVRLYIK